MLYTAAFCSGVRFTHLRNSSFRSGVSSTISPSAKNCDKVMPKPLQIASSVVIEGIVLRRNIFDRVDSDRPHDFDNLYSVQPRSVKSWRSL